MKLLRVNPKGSWALRDKPPIAATGMGGLEVRKAAERGNIFDHHSVVYEYDDGARHFHQCRQMTSCGRDVSTHLWGTKGYSHVEKYLIKDPEGNTSWSYKGEKNIMHQTEHDEFFAALRAGKTINDGEYMCRSTMLAILGRMAAYSGQRVTWDQAINSKEDLSPANYNFGPFPTPKVAVPGVYKVF
ncbi:MAG: hypothetical protein EXR99_15705 [Gemmataceae bacterium]|nr:hypothetical protein [Gemmataceae bacterium]